MVSEEGVKPQKAPLDFGEQPQAEEGPALKISSELLSHSLFLESFEESGLRFAAQQILGAVCLGCA